MNTEERPIPSELARHVRETMTVDEARYAYDDTYNVFAALEEDADVVFILANRAREYGATDLDSFIKGYEAGRDAAKHLRPIAHEEDQRSTPQPIARRA